MDLLNRQTLKDLAQTEAAPCISLFMPTFRFEADQEQNAIRYKNLLKEAKNQLKEMGRREEEIDTLLKDARARMDDTVFWRNVSDGLAVFITEGATRFFRLPIDFEELAVVGGRFHLKPLFPLIASNNRYYVLALSQNDVRVYQGTHYAISELDGKDIPESIIEALAFDDPEKSLQQHTANQAGGRRDAEFHGHGGDEDDASARPQVALKRFFDQIDEGLRGILQDENAPLVLAGVEYYLPIYREANKYPHLIDDQIAAGNPEHLHPKELHAKTWAIVEPLFQSAQEESVDQFHQQNGNDGQLASHDLREIIPASVFSRVQTLFVPIGQHQWGRYDAEENAVQLHEDQQPEDDDLLNLATVHTYLNGGTVHALQPGNMPVEASLAATFRYPADVSATEA